MSLTKDEEEKLKHYKREENLYFGFMMVTSMLLYYTWFITVPCLLCVIFEHNGAPTPVKIILGASLLVAIVCIYAKIKAERLSKKCSELEISKARGTSSYTGSYQPTPSDPEHAYFMLQQQAAQKSEAALREQERQEAQYRNWDATGLLNNNTESNSQLWGDKKGTWQHREQEAREWDAKMKGWYGR